MLLTVDFMFVQRAWASWSVCSKVGWFWGLDVWSVRASQRGERTSRTSVSLCLMTSPAAPMTSLRVRIFTTISCKIVVMEGFCFFCGCGFYFPPFYLKNLVFLGGVFSVSPDPKPELKTLKWAISQFASVERIFGEDKYFCETCHHYTEAERSLLFDKTPEVITIHLKRFSANGLEWVHWSLSYHTAALHKLYWNEFELVFEKVIAVPHA